eukprot:3154320-Prymnesium_polylepis.2
MIDCAVEARQLRTAAHHLSVLCLQGRTGSSHHAHMATGHGSALPLHRAYCPRVNGRCCLFYRLSPIHGPP